MRPLHEIVETPAYLAAAARARMTEDDRAAVAAFIAADPQAGDLIKGSGGVRKVRVAKPGGGKSGGWRVLTAYVSDTVAVLVVMVYGKNQRGNVSKAEINEMAKLMKALKAEARRKED